MLGFDVGRQDCDGELFRRAYLRPEHSADIRSAGFGVHAELDVYQRDDWNHHPQPWSDNTGKWNRCRAGDAPWNPDVYHDRCRPRW